MRERDKVSDYVTCVNDAETAEKDSLSQDISKKKITRILSVIRHSWITAWLVVIAVYFAVTASYAAYMGAKTSKRVISLFDRDSMLFSSRYMAAGDVSVQEQGIAAGTDDPAILVNVANSDRTGMEVYGNDIHFRFKARLVDRSTGNELNTDPGVKDEYTVYYYENGSETDSPKHLTLTNEFQYFGTSGNTTNPGSAYLFTLPGGTMTNLYFNVHFPASELVTPAYAVEIVAEATDGYDDIKNLNGKIAVTARTSSSAEWSGYFADIQTNKPAYYDAYNYTISGAGKGTITLTYDTNYVVLDRNDKAVFRNLPDGAKVTEATAEDSKETIEFHVDTTIENAVSYYSVRFYRAGKINNENGTELVMDGFTDEYVKTEFTPDTSGE